MARAAPTAACLEQPLAKATHLRPRPSAQGHAALHGSAHDAGKRQGALGERIFRARVVLSGLESAATQEPLDPSPDRAEHLLHLRIARRKGGPELERPCRRPDEHSVEGERVKVHVQVESTAEALDHRQCAGTAVGDAVASGLIAVEVEQRSRMDC